MDAAGAMVLAGTADPTLPTSDAAGSIEFAGTLGTPEVSGGTISAEASGQIQFSGFAHAFGFDVYGEIAFGGTATGSVFVEGQVTVPYLIGSTLTPALTAIASIYCVPSVNGTSGTVVFQSPDAFTYVDRGSVITITLGGPVNHSSGDRRGLPRYNSGVQ